MSERLKKIFIKLTDIELNDKYQNRKVDALSESEAYVYRQIEKEDIKQKALDLKNGDKNYRFKPLDVIRAPEGSDKPYILTHGFHRFEAYQQYAQRSSYSIPVYVIDSEAEAQRRAHQDNSEAKLVMPKKMITESAWQLLARGTVDGKTQKEAAAELRISESTVKNMRKALKQIREVGLFIPFPQPDYPKADQEAHLWKDTLERMNGGKPEGYEMDFGTVAQQMVKLWKEDIISSYAEGDIEWFMEQAKQAMKAVLQSEIPDRSYLSIQTEIKIIGTEY